ncbi:MAG: hypothetical protein P8Y76_07850 [bacterium]
MLNSVVRFGLVSLVLGLCGTPLGAIAKDGVFSCPAGQVAHAINIKAQQFTCVALPDTASDLAALQALVNAQTALIDTLQTAVAELQAKLGCMSKTGDDVYFTGCNVHVRNGLGATGPVVNGLGNLIVGYNEDASNLPFDPALEPSVRTGSHNVVVGAGHSYTDRGGLVVGVANRITDRFATITGGLRNTASAPYANVSGGFLNTASGMFSSVSGGYLNNATASYASVSGGRENTASGESSSVSGGHQNTAGASQYSSVSGGFQNTASGFAASVSGGGDNTASGASASVSGGQLNTANGVQSSSVSGGFNGNASGSFSSVSGGNSRAAASDNSRAAGGLFELN